MLTIREPQWKAIERGFLRSFARRAFARFEKLAGPPRQPLDAEQACTLVDSAKAYGLDNQRQIAVFLAMAWVYGPRFELEIPGLQEILSDALPADSKADYLRALLASRGVRDEDLR